MQEPVTPSRLVRDLRALGVRSGEVALVHSSLSAIAGADSFVVGGAVGLIEALMETMGTSGTLVMPAFTADYADPASWTNPPVPAHVWPSLREEIPAWRADRARTFRIGVVAETFRSFGSVLRSDHPHSSFCAWGEHAAAITASVPLDDPLGPAGPLGRLRELDARVLLVGCGFGSCTAFHLGEHETRTPPPRITSSAPVRRDGTRTWIRWSEPRYDASRFAAIGEAFVASGACKSGRIGAAESHTFALGDSVAFAARWLDEHGLDER